MNNKWISVERVLTVGGRCCACTLWRHGSSVWSSGGARLSVTTFWYVWLKSPAYPTTTV